MGIQANDTVVLTGSAAIDLQRAGVQDARKGMLAKVIQAYTRDCLIELIDSAYSRPPWALGWRVDLDEVRRVRKRGFLGRHFGPKEVLQELVYLNTTHVYYNPQETAAKRARAYKAARKLVGEAGIKLVGEQEMRGEIREGSTVLLTDKGATFVKKLFEKSGVRAAVKPKTIGQVVGIQDDKYLVALRDFGDHGPVTLKRTHFIVDTQKPPLEPGMLPDPEAILAELVYIRDVLRYVRPAEAKRRRRLAMRKALRYLRAVDTGIPLAW